MDIYERLRRNLRLLRTSNDLSASELSAKLKWSNKRVADIEDLNRGTAPQLQELDELCDFFNISINDLFHKVAVIKFEYPD